MELWEFNAYLKGYNENVLYLQEIMMTKQAYYTGMFSGFRKPKSLSYYLHEIDKSFGKIKKEAVDIKKAKDIYKTIERLKHGK